MAEKLKFEQPIEMLYQPVFKISENQLTGIGDRKIGERIKFIIDYTAIEKMKSYLVIRVNNGYLINSARKF